MSAKGNHHFVPKYLFRLFSGGKAYIHLVLKASSEIKLRTPIRSQGARHKFYGSDEVENWLMVLDDRHARAYRAAIRECWGNAPAGFTLDELYWLFQAVAIQRFRTPRAAESLAHVGRSVSLYMFSKFVETWPDESMRAQLRQAVDRRQVTFEEPRLQSLLESVELGFRSTIGLTDLNFVLLRNLTRVPFVFGDSPCVFYNRYLHEFRSRSGLGVQSPGLMIFMPLDQKTQVMLFDPATYRVASSATVVPVMDATDVGQLNALQIHSATNAIYFADQDSSEYLVGLVDAHRPLFKRSHNEFMVRRPPKGAIEGESLGPEIAHPFESQLPVRLDLSFVTTQAKPSSGDLQRVRSPELNRELQELLSGC